MAFSSRCEKDARVTPSPVASASIRAFSEALDLLPWPLEMDALRVLGWTVEDGESLRCEVWGFSSIAEMDRTGR